MRTSVVTKILFATTFGSLALTAFRTPVADSAEMLLDRNQDHMVIGAAIAGVFTGQAALRGIVMPDSTIDALLNDQLNDKSSALVSTHFPNHKQYIPLMSKDFSKAKPKMKIDRVLLDVPKNKIDFESGTALVGMGLLLDTPTDSSWRILKAKYPDATNFAAFSLPGYDSGKEMAMVSYFSICGPSCYQKGYVVLEKSMNTRTWRMIHRNIVFGGG